MHHSTDIIILEDGYFFKLNYKPIFGILVRIGEDLLLELQFNSIKKQKSIIFVLTNDFKNDRDI